MGYLAGGPIASVNRTVTPGSALYDGQRQIAIPGGFQPGMTDVYVGGACITDYDDTDGMQIILSKGMQFGTEYRVVSYNPYAGVQPVVGQLAGFRNLIANGNFDFWYRGTSLSAGTGFRYLADRWQSAGAGSTVAPSQQAFTLGQTAVPGEPQFFHRCVVASAAGANNFARFQQNMEGVRTLAGQPGALSFFAKADAPKNISVDFAQAFGAGGSPSATVEGIGAVRIPITSSWVQYRVPVTLPSISGKTIGSSGGDLLAARFWFDAGSSFNAITANLGQQSGTFDIAQVQFEPGSVVTQFEKRLTAVELEICQRFYQLYPNLLCGGNTGAGGTVYMDHVFATPMRITPAIAVVGGPLSYINASNMTVNNAFASSVRFQLQITSAGYGIGYGASWSFDAEL